MTLCDIGNTTYHFLDEQKEFKYSIDESLHNLVVSSPIYFISVNDKASVDFLSQFPDAIDLKNTLHFSTHYAQTLGIDRAIACSGIKSGIVVDFGSAITVDIMENRFHLGGYIFPGIEALQEIYPHISNKLHFDFNLLLNIETIPTTTNDAINNAIYLMIVEPIKAIQNRYKLPLIFTGEQSKNFIDFFVDVTYDAHLIFNNMKLLIKLEN